MPKFLLLIMALLPASAQTLTRVNGVFQDAAKNRLSGYCDITTYYASTSVDATRTVPSTVRINFYNGNFTVRLVPTDTATPQVQYYAVECNAPRQTVNGIPTSGHWGPFIWQVPTSSLAVDISRVESVEIPLETIVPSSGQFCLNVTNGKVVGTTAGVCGTGTGSSTSLSLAVITSSDISSITQSQVSNIVQ